jgi:hypothetical protein
MTVLPYIVVVVFEVVSVPIVIEEVEPDPVAIAIAPALDAELPIAIEPKGDV